MPESRLLKTYEEIRTHANITVRVSYKEVDRIVVAAMLEKYQWQVVKNDEKNMELFKNVLRFYLTEEELCELLLFA